MTILQEVEIYLNSTGTGPAVLGRHACRDTGLIREMRLGRQIRAEMAERLRKAMQENPAGIPDADNRLATPKPIAPLPKPAGPRLPDDMAGIAVADTAIRRAAEAGSKALLRAILTHYARRRLTPSARISPAEMDRLCAEHDVYLPPARAA